jgi:hypothetical protein
MQANCSEDSGQVPQHSLSRNAQHAPAEPTELCIPAAVRRMATEMPGAIDFEDEPSLGGSEVSDEERSDRDLPAELHPESPATNGGPEDALGFGLGLPEAERVHRELSLTTSLVARLERRHSATRLLQPSGGPGAASARAGSMTGGGWYPDADALPPGRERARL